MGIADPAVGLLGLHFGQQHVDRIGLAGHLAQAGEPGRELRIFVRQSVDRLLELDVPPDAELVEVVVRLGPLQVVQRRLGLAPVVQQIGEIDPRLAGARVELERPPEPVERPRVVAQPVGSVAQAGRRIGRLGVGRRGQVEEAVGRRDQSLAEERPPDLQHQLVILLEPQLQNALASPHGPRAVAQLEQGLAQAGEPIFVIGVERQRLLEAPPGPGVLFPGQMGIGLPDMELDGVGVEEDTFVQDGQRFIVSAFVVELMSLFVEVVGAEECVRHRPASPG